MVNSTTHNQSNTSGDRGQFIFSPFEFLITRCVYVCNQRGSSYGADIWNELSTCTGREYASGAVYTGLNRLIAQSYLSKRKKGDGKQHYELTPLGYTALIESMNDYINLVNLSSFIEKEGL